MKKLFILFVITLISLTSCENKPLYERKTFVDRTIRLDGINDPVANIPWIQKKYLAFQEDLDHVKSRALILFTAYGDDIPHVFEYCKQIQEGEMIQHCYLYDINGSPFYIGGNSESILSKETAVFLDSIILKKIDIVTFPGERGSNVQSRYKKMIPEDIHENIDTILNSAKYKILSCSMLVDVPQ